MKTVSTESLGSHLASPVLALLFTLGSGGCSGASNAGVAEGPVESAPTADASTPPVTPPPADSSAAPTTMTPLVPPAPFTVAVRGTKVADLAAHRLDDGSVLVPGFDGKGGAVAFALLRGDRVERLVGLEKGAPSSPSATGKLVFGGTLPNDLWAARSEGKSGCEVTHWDGATWSTASPVPSATCVEIRSVGDGSALAVVDDGSGRVTLRQLGKPFTAPSMSGCPPLCSSVHLATGSSSTEIVWAGIVCPSERRPFPAVGVSRWKRGEAKAACAKTDFDANAPVVGYTAESGQLVLSGLALPKGAAVSEENMQHMEIRYGMSRGKLGAIGTKIVAMNELEHWSAEVQTSKPATATSEGFEARDVVLAAIGEAVVVGFVVRPDGTKQPAVLRSTKVAAPVEL